MKSFVRFVLHAVPVFLLASMAGAAFWRVRPAPPGILREGQAKYQVLDAATLPADTAPKLFAGEITGTTFELFVRSLDAQLLTLELGFIDTESKAAQQHTFSLAANGTPVDANLDVFAKAGGAFKPWVMKTTFNHAGGSLSLLFTGLEKPAFVSYAAHPRRAGPRTRLRRRQGLGKARAADPAGFPVAPVPCGEGRARCRFSMSITARSAAGRPSSTGWRTAAACRSASSPAGTVRSSRTRA